MLCVELVASVYVVFVFTVENVQFTTEVADSEIPTGMLVLYVYTLHAHTKHTCTYVCTHICTYFVLI